LIIGLDKTTLTPFLVQETLNSLGLLLVPGNVGIISTLITPAAARLHRVV
jgi:hypothetical protein